MPLICPTCGAVSPDDAHFCEADGTPLQPNSGAPRPVAALNAMSAASPACPAPVSGGCASCGAGPEANEGGWCSACGKRWRVAPAADRRHKEIALSVDFGAVSDIGHRHTANEDDFGLARLETAAGPVTLIVVCDGVSSSEDGARASGVAVDTALAHLKGEASGADVAAAMISALHQANLAVNALAPSTPGVTTDPPETTIVAAHVQARTATIGWVGDSRAYWFADGQPPRQLTHDHSWMYEVTDSGQMTMEEALRDRRAHAITRCLGGSTNEEDSAPSLVTVVLPETESGWLLLCTDGLWNYADDAVKIADLLAEAQAPDEGASKQTLPSDAVALAGWLVDWANGCGGRDNITVALARF